MGKTLRRLILFLLIPACAALNNAGTQSPAPALHADSILILKKQHLMELFSQGKIIRTYHVALGSGGLAPKEKVGDGRTPEGHYIIDSRNAASRYHLALHVSYPNAEDIRRAKLDGTSPGGAIMIHGLPKEWAWLGSIHHFHDWTRGCIAVSDDEIDEIWKLVPIGTPVEIRAE